MQAEEFLRLVTDHYSTQDIESIGDAINLATKAHTGQFRSSGDPYITHPLSVAAILVGWRMDIDSVLVGILHDTVEDTDVTLEEIDIHFGADVARLVDSVTKVGKARSGMRELDTYLPQTKDNLSKLLIATSKDLRALIIKLADRLHNLRTLEYLTPAQQTKIAKESLEVFAPLADRLGMGLLRSQIEELSFEYLYPEKSRKLLHELKSRIRKAQRQFESIQQNVIKALESEGIKFEIDGRVKSLYSLHKKLAKVGTIDNVYDLLAQRIVVSTTAQCYQVLGILHNLFRPMPTRIKDYIASPKPNGYQSLHTTVMTPHGGIVEFQIRTRDMHEFAERGLAASFYYNEQKLSEEYVNRNAQSLPRHLQWVAQLQEAAKELKKGGDFNPEDLKVDLFSDRIFVYSPKGDIFDLPVGSFPLDFAFAVHADIATHAASFKVNGHITAFDKPLENGDFVEVVTRGNIKPHIDWLHYVHSSRAKQKLRHCLREEQVTN